MVAHGLILEGTREMIEAARNTPEPIPLFIGFEETPAGTVSDLLVGKQPNGTTLLFGAFNGLDVKDFPEYYRPRVEVWNETGHIRQVRMIPENLSLTPDVVIVQRP